MIDKRLPIIYGVTLDDPPSDIVKYKDDTFRVNCTPETNGASAGINVSIEYNSTDFTWKEIETSGSVNLTADMNPHTDVENDTMYSSLVTARTPATYNVRCRIYNSTTEINSSSQQVTVNPTTYEANITGPTTSNPVIVDAGDEITINFTFTRNGVPLTSNVNVTNVTVGGKPCNITSVFVKPGSNATWTQRFPANQPAFTRFQAAAYDSWHDVAIFFGGTDASATVGINETWVYDYATNIWTNMTPTATGSIPPLYKASMSFDSKRGVAILTGGTNSDTGLDEDATYEYNYSSNTWTAKADMPDVKIKHGMAYDIANDKTLSFAGWRNTFGGADVNTIYIYNYSSNSWASPDPDTKPHIREFGAETAMAYDTLRNVSWIFGGYAADISATLEDLWMYNYTVGNQGNWTNYTNASNPRDREGHAMVYLEWDDALLLHSGRNSGGGYYNDTWLYNLSNNTWVNLSLSTTPGPRRQAAMVYSPRYKVAIFFGGYYGSPFSDTWIYAP